MSSAGSLGFSTNFQKHKADSLSVYTNVGIRTHTRKFPKAKALQEAGGFLQGFFIQDRRPASLRITVYSSVTEAAIIIISVTGCAQIMPENPNT